MKTTHKHKGVKYTFSNENLKVGDKVYPISWGKSDSQKGTYKHEKFDFRDFMSGFPDEPHTILNLKHSDYKPYEVHTSHGFSPKECYFKIISKTKNRK